jgi:adenylate cyclase
VTTLPTSPRARRLASGLSGSALICLLFLALLASGRAEPLRLRALDALFTTAATPSPSRGRLAIVYIDQKSIDYFQRTQAIGWPWPRDAYALITSYLCRAGARAVVFDALFSEPSVFRQQFDDDAAFGRAQFECGRVYQTLLFHRQAKGGAPNSPEQMRLLGARALKLEGAQASSIGRWNDVTMPIPELLGTAAGLGAINLTPDPDGICRRMQLLYGAGSHLYPALPLAVFLGLEASGLEASGLKGGAQERLRLAGGVLTARGRSIPVDANGQLLVNYHAGAPYPATSAVAVIQAAVDLDQNRAPMLDPSLFKDKVVLVGARAAGLYDLRATPLAEALPGVEIQATVLDNLLSADFLRAAEPWLSALTLAAAVALGAAGCLLLPGTLAGTLASGLVAAALLAASFALFRRNLWLDASLPLAALAATWAWCALVNFYCEGREKRHIRRAFSHYLSPELVEEISRRPGALALGGTRRELTVFFSDLAGFTSISERLSPEELVALLNRYLDLMSAIILEAGGTIDKYEGDAVMAFWGAPVAVPDHAARACLAALAQREAALRLAGELASEGLPPLSVRMGLNTGPAVVGNMGGRTRFNYTAMGDTVNLASRLEGANKAYGTGIMISEETRRQAGSAVVARELDLLRVKGKTEPIRVFELVGRSGEVPAEMEDLLALFARGLALYREMHFAEAAAAFTEALALSPEDGPSRVYVERCREMIASPPAAAWDRVYSLTTK